MSERPKKDVTWSVIERILADPRSKDFGDLRDRAAHMYLTGGFPSHLREFFTSALRIISSDQELTVQAVPGAGPIGIAKEVVRRLELDGHPMVVAVRRRDLEGWKIRPSLGPDRRRPFTKVFMYLGSQKITVQIDGSVLDHWPLQRPTQRAGRSRQAAVRTKVKTEPSPPAPL